MLNRTTRSVSLTPAGTASLDGTRPAIETLDAVMQQARHRQVEPAGLIRIHCFRRAASLLLAPMLRALTDRHPLVVLDITPDGTVVDMVAGYGEPVTPRDLQQHRCIRWRWQGRPEPEPWQFWSNGRWFTVAVAGPVIVNDRDLETHAAAAGIGLPARWPNG